ncbi:putative septum site-determining protein MinC [[Clostridium] ultunense Esp]|uniref:Probable septum site-determining protein MinC n=1 Tax=[Clostridium] ultunense Esp TaxID=1288971 RepID=M1ZIG0_9FIRM|nr:septum site-determining protein MinC [Schnuerera ultunensis]CCQ98394.1 putative septum site-determining protein MinC [[Clostridium] ultunense Esp]SHD77946.1 putative septum site-determining protein MinC [[Clostridium] ultunense Esp]
MENIYGEAFVEVIPVKEGLVNFRGIKEGIYIYIREGDFKHIKRELEDKLKESIDFFKGANLLGIKGENISDNEVDELLKIIQDKYKLHISEAGLPSYLEEEKPYEGIYEGMTKFINTTIRSGQVIEYDGNIVIIGDVNPGALIKAKGNIIILGTLRGVAHAGIDGNYKAIVAAYDLQPTQLRIGNIIGRKPDGDIITSGMPEIARICDGEVLIEPYLPRK